MDACKFSQLGNQDNRGQKLTGLCVACLPEILARNRLAS